MVTSSRSENHGNKGCHVFRKWNRKVTSPRWNRIILWNFCAILSRFTVEMTPQSRYWRPLEKLLESMKWLAREGRHVSALSQRPFTMGWKERSNRSLNARWGTPQVTSRWSLCTVQGTTLRTTCHTLNELLCSTLAARLQSSILGHTLQRTWENVHKPPQEWRADQSCTFCFWRSPSVLSHGSFGKTAVTNE